MEKVQRSNTVPTAVGMVGSEQQNEEIEVRSPIDAFM